MADVTTSPLHGIEGSREECSSQTVPVLVQGSLTPPISEGSSCRPYPQTSLIPVILDPGQPHSEISEDYVLVHRLLQTHLRSQSDGLSLNGEVTSVTRVVSCNLDIPARGGLYRAVGIHLRVCHGRDLAVGGRRGVARLGSDWFAGVKARLQDGDLDCGSELEGLGNSEGVVQLADGFTWEAGSSWIHGDDRSEEEVGIRQDDIPDVFRGMCVCTSLPEGSQPPWSVEKGTMGLKNDSMNTEAGPSNCWYSTRVFVADKANPTSPVTIPLKVHRLQYDASQPPPGGDLRSTGKRLVHFMELGLRDNATPTRISQFSQVVQFIIPDHLSREYIMGRVPEDLLGPIVALHAEYLLSFPTAPDQHKNRITNYLLRLSTVFSERMDSRYSTGADGELIPTSRILFNDYYTADVLVLAFSVIVREFSVPREIIEEGIRLGFRFLKFCVHNARHPDSDFADCTGYCWVGRVLELETAANNLVFCFQQHYMLTEELDVLDEAMRLCREACRLPDIGSSMRLALSHKLATLLRHRVLKQEDASDIEEAIAVTERCLELATDDFDRGNAHAYLTQAYQLRYRYEQVAEDLAQALEHASKAVELGLEGDMAALLMSHASVLELKYSADHHLADLDHAIELSRKALDHPRIKPYDYRCQLSNLALLLLKRMEETQDELQALEYATGCRRYIEEALKYAIPGFHSRTLLYKAQLLISTRSPFHDINASLAVVKEIVDDEAYLAGERIECVTKYWMETRFFDNGGIARDTETVQKFLNVVVSAVHLLPRLANFNLAVSDRLKSLRRVGEGLTMTAAASAMSLGQIGLALEMIEEGRATFWSQALNLRIRHELDNLPEELRLAIIKQAAFLEEGSLKHPSTSVFTDNLQHRDSAISRQRQAAAEFLKLVERARQIPGFERFMRPHSYAYLATAAAKGPIVLLVTDDECFALLIRQDGSMGKLRLLIPLDMVNKLVDMWDLASRRARQRSRDGLPPEDQLVSEDDELYLAVKNEFYSSTGRTVKKPNKPTSPTHAELVLANLWVFVARPVLAALNIPKPTSTTQRGRLWWCVTRAFAHLPIHAAGWYGDQEDFQCCSDYVISSYTPTLQALIDARRFYKPVKQAGARVLLGAAPRPYRGTFIPATVEEIRLVSQIVPAELLVPLDFPDDALLNSDTGGISVTTALNLLAKEQVTVLHIASHGLQDLSDPLSSGFLLRDGKLTILDLMRTRLGPSTFLAFLSACETAKMSKEFAHEAVHLAATMLFAGFKSVVGTLWPMDDVDGPEIAERVYKRLFEGENEYFDPDVIPRALDEAVLELRAKNVSPSRWATYIHIGM